MGLTAELMKERGRLNAGYWSEVVTASLGMNLCRHVEDVFLTVPTVVSRPASAGVNREANLSPHWAAHQPGHINSLLAITTSRYKRILLHPRDITPFNS